jgi:RNA polymerase sigma-70 factor (ECF subfamily)
MSVRRNDFLPEFHQCRPELQAYVSRRLGHQEADDLVQETCLRVLQYPAIETIQNLRAFFFKTASNLVVDRVRQDRTRSEDLQEEANLDSISSPMPTPEAVTDGALQLRRFQDALAELPLLCRHAFLLNRLDGLTHAQVSKRLGISKKTVERYVLRAFDHCYTRLGRVHASSKRA